MPASFTSEVLLLPRNFRFQEGSEKGTYFERIFAFVHSQLSDFTLTDSDQQVPVNVGEGRTRNTQKGSGREKVARGLACFDW